jgi:pimeloyl-ACP methyl ester carboxylesterase
VRATLFDTAVALSPQVNERPVEFTVDGQAVRGILTTVVDSQPVALLFVHGWGGVRGGPHNLLTHLARAAGEAGCCSLRFDLRGRGESDGAAPAACLASMAADTVAAAECLKSDCGVCNIVIVGICSGGNIAIAVCDRVPDVRGLFMLSVYPFSDGDNFGRDVRRTVHFIKVYWDKLWRRQTWDKLVRGEIFFGSILRVLFGHYQRDQRQASGDGTPASPLESLRQHPVPVTIIYGAADPDYQASFDYFAEFASKSGVDIGFHTIPGANHNFYSEAWKQEITGELLEFIAAVSAQTQSSIDAT